MSEFWDRTDGRPFQPLYEEEQPHRSRRDQQPPPDEDASNFDPDTIRQMAKVLNVVSIVIGAVAGLLAGVWLLASVLVAKQGVAPLIWLGYVGSAVATFGIGFLVALTVRVVAQLMLALVQIEQNTRLAAESKRATRPTRSPAALRVGTPVFDDSESADDAIVADPGALDAATEVAMRAERE